MYVCKREKNNSFEIHVIILRYIQGWYSQGRKLWFSVKSRKVKKSQGKSRNSSGGLGEKYILKFESQGISNLQYFSFNGFNSFEIFLSFDCGKKN